jgi:hypothetical protein
MEPYVRVKADGSRFDTLTIVSTVDLDELLDRKSVVPFFRRRAVPAVAHGKARGILMVFASTGALIGDVRTPDRLRIQQIGENWLLGIWAVADNVEYVRLHRILKNK